MESGKRSVTSGPSSFVIGAEFRTDAIEVYLTQIEHRNQDLVLGKVLSLNADGHLVTRADAALADGYARRVAIPIDGWQQAFLDYKLQMLQHEAFTWGTYQPSFAGQVELTTVDKLSKRLRVTGATCIARSKDHLKGRHGQPGIATIDADTSGEGDGNSRTPDLPALKLRTREDFINALTAVCPALADGGYLLMESSSAGVSRRDNGNVLRGLNRWHLHVLFKDSLDIDRSLDALHKRLWLNGFGWILISQAGALLPRSPVDRAMRVSCQPTFSVPTLSGDLIRAVPDPKIHLGPAFDSEEVISPLSYDKEVAYREAVESAKRRVQAEHGDLIARLKEKYLRESAGKRAQAAALRGETIDEEAIYKRLKAADQHADVGILMPDHVLEFDDGRIFTVGDVLANLREFDERTLADPLEGRSYGPGKAIVYANLDRPRAGPLIHSLAHGESRSYHLRFDFDHLGPLLEAMDSNQLATDGLDQIRAAVLDAPERDLIADLVSKRSPLTKASVKETLAKAYPTDDDEVARLRRLRAQQRNRLPVIYHDQLMLNHTIHAIAGVLFDSEQTDPVMQYGGRLVGVVNKVPAYAFEGVPNESPEEPQLILEPFKAPGLRQRIEDSVVIRQLGKSIAVPTRFATELMGSLGLHNAPAVAGIIEHPIIRADGGILHTPGYDAGTRLYVGSSAQLLEAPVPLFQQEAADRLKWLAEVWLDEFPFATEEDRQLTIAAAMTLIQRSLLPEAPGLCIDSTVQSAGKTALAELIYTSITASGISKIPLPEDEYFIETLVFAALREGVSCLLFDNARRGRKLDSPSIAAMITSSDGMSGRVFKTSDLATVTSRVMPIITGVNVSLSGDFVSRFLRVRLDPDEEQPEKRTFRRHLRSWAKDPKNRTMVLTSLLGILAGYQKYLANGGAPVELEVGGRFQKWNSAVAAPLVWAGGLDPNVALASNVEGDPIAISESRALDALVTLVGLDTPFRCRDVAKRLDYFRDQYGSIYSPGGSEAVIWPRGTAINESTRQPTKEALQSLRTAASSLLEAHAEVHPRHGASMHARSVESVAITLGKWFSEFEGRLHDGMRLDRQIDSSTKSYIYCVTSVEET